MSEDIHSSKNPIKGAVAGGKLVVNHAKSHGLPVKPGKVVKGVVKGALHPTQMTSALSIQQGAFEKKHEANMKKPEVQKNLAAMNAPKKPPVPSQASKPPLLPKPAPKGQKFPAPTPTMAGKPLPPKGPKPPLLPKPGKKAPK